MCDVVLSNLLACEHTTIVTVPTTVTTCSDESGPVTLTCRSIVNEDRV